jgi:hypothetical protein
MRSRAWEIWHNLYNFSLSIIHDHNDLMVQEEKKKNN